MYIDFLFNTYQSLYMNPEAIWPENSEENYRSRVIEVFERMTEEGLNLIQELIALQEKQEKEAFTPEKLRELFDSFDENKDGHISKMEAISMLTKLKLSINSEFVEILHKMDTNGDGKITFDEFQDFFTQNKIPRSEGGWLTVINNYTATMHHGFSEYADEFKKMIPKLDSYSICLKSGEIDISNSHIVLQSETFLESKAEEAWAELSKGLDVGKHIGAVARMKSSNPKALAAVFENTVKQILKIIKAELNRYPNKEHQALIDSIKYGFIAREDEVIAHVAIEDDLLLA